MLKVNLLDGQTISYDLTNAIERRIWQLWQGDDHFQAIIRGIGVQHEGVLYVLPIPRRFRKSIFFATPLQAGNAIIGEQVRCQADGVRVSLSVYHRHGPRPKMVRVDVERTGMPRFVVGTRAS